MAECPDPKEAVQSVAGETLSAFFKYSKDGRDILINISTNGNVQVMVRDVCKTVVTLGALYTAYQLLKPLIDSTVTRGLGGERDDQEVRDIKPGSLKVLLHCLTDERFLEVLDDYECGRLKDRLQKEFSQSGIEMKDMKVEILNMEEVSKTKKAINIRKRKDEAVCIEPALESHTLSAESGEEINENMMTLGDEEWKKRLNDSGYKNWLKVSLALIEAKEALHDFTENVIDAIHNDIKTRIGSGTCTATPACNTRKKGGGITGKAPSCPSCAQWVIEIKKQSNGQLHWKNTDPTKWHNVPWEIAKCFMNAQGDKATASANTGPDKTALLGMLNVLVNCKEIRLNHLKDKTLPEHVRTVRNDLMHCATMSFSDADMQDMVDQVIALLEDDKELKHLKICREKVKIIKSLRDKEFELMPKHEEVCIEAALESHALAADSGEEIDESMMSKLSKLIKGNKELERKFDDKVNKIDEKLANMKQECDAEISRVDIYLGELKGRIEFLEKPASGQSFPSSNPTSSVLGHEIKSFYKNALQSCAQKKKLDIPKYNTNETEEKMFVSIVLFDGKEFKSKPKPSKKEAEQDAAEEALKFLGNEDSEVSNEKNESPSAELQVMDSTLSTQQKDKNYKNLLQEKAQKQKIPYPIYFNKKTDAGFLSEVMYDGGTYSPVMDPQNRKVDAEQKAAQFVLTYLNREEERSELTSGNASPLPENASDVEGREVSATKNASKQFKVILNKHVQKKTKGQLPEYKAEKNSDGKFVCTVTVFGEVYKSPSGVNSISDAKESAASEACKVLQLAEAVSGNSPRPADLDSKKEEIPVIEPTSDESDDATPIEL